MPRNISDFVTSMNETGYLVLITRKISVESMPTWASWMRSAGQIWPAGQGLRDAALHHVNNLHCNSPEVCLSKLANCRSQFLLDRLGRCLKLFVSTESTSCIEFASQFGLAFFIRQKHPCVRAWCVCHKLYDNTIWPRLIMIIIKIITLYFIQITHTDDSTQRVPG